MGPGELFRVVVHVLAYFHSSTVVLLRFIVSESFFFIPERVRGSSRQAMSLRMCRQKVEV